MQILYHAVAYRQTYLITDFQQLETLLEQEIIEPYHMLYNLENQHAHTLAEVPGFQPWIAERSSKLRREEIRNKKIKAFSLSLFFFSILLAAGKLFINIRFEKPGFDTHPYIISYCLQEFFIFWGGLCLLFTLLNFCSSTKQCRLPLLFSSCFFCIQILAFALTLQHPIQIYQQTKNTLNEMTLLYQSVHTFPPRPWSPENHELEKNQALLAKLREHAQNYLTLQQKVFTGINLLSETPSLTRMDKDKPGKLKEHIRQFKQWSKESEFARQSFLQEYFLTLQKLAILSEKKSKFLQDFNENTQRYAEVGSAFFSAQRETLEKFEPHLTSHIHVNSIPSDENTSANLPAFPTRWFPTFLTP